VGVPIWWRGEVIGVLSLLSLQEDVFTGEQAETLRLFAEAISTALHNARLFAQAQELATVKERQRMARDLHDAINQTLYSASVLAQTLPALAKRDPARVVPELGTLNRLIRGAQAEMRVLLLELRPEQLKRIGLREQYAQLITAFEGRSRDVEVKLHLDNGHELPSQVEEAFYRITQEALNNIAKHARAKTVEIELVTSPRGVRLKVADDGRGFDLKSGNRGMGLTSMRERAQNIGADLSLASAPGEGTRLAMVWQRPLDRS
jgi:signal transduction histidine kinase